MEEHGSDAEDAEFYNDFSNPTLEARQIEEILYLNPSDHPGMQLVAAQLTGMNFLNWNISVLRSLGTQSKIELIDGMLSELDPSMSYYKQWLKTDYMVSS